MLDLLPSTLTDVLGLARSARDLHLPEVSSALLGALAWISSRPRLRGGRPDALVLSPTSPPPDFRSSLSQGYRGLCGQPTTRSQPPLIYFTGWW